MPPTPLYAESTQVVPVPDRDNAYLVTLPAAEVTLTVTCDQPYGSSNVFVETESIRVRPTGARRRNILSRERYGSGRIFLDSFVIASKVRKLVGERAAEQRAQGDKNRELRERLARAEAEVAAVRRELGE